MKIVHLSEFYLDNWKYQENLLPAYQAKLGHEVTLLASENYPLYLKNKPYLGEKKYIHNDIKIVRYVLKSHLMTFNLYGIKELILNEKPDLLFIHGIHFLKSRSIRELLSGNYKFKISMDSHADYFSSGFYSSSKIKKIKAIATYKLVYKKLINNYLNRLYRFFCVSPASEIFAHEVLSIPVNKIYSLPLGVVLDDIPFDQKSSIRKEIRLEYKIPFGAVVVVTAGKQDREKRSIFLAQVFNLLQNREAYLLIVGSIEDDIREGLSLEVEKNHKIILPGWKEPHEMIKIMLAADIAVFPGSQSVLWQHALGCGLPAIFKYWSGVEYLSIGNALFLKTMQEQELLEHISYLIDNKEAREKMGRLAREHCINKFNYEVIAKTSIE
jgi:glycosyltransferase involved in cell wall biosynthesis